MAVTVWHDAMELAIITLKHKRQEVAIPFQAGRGRWEKAAALYAEALQRGPVAPVIWQRYALVRLRSGDPTGYRKVCEAMLKTIDHESPAGEAAQAVSRASVVGPDAVAVYQPVLALAEFAVKKLPRRSSRPQQLRHELLRTLGAALYRAGLTQEAIDRLNEAIAADKGRSVVQDWLFLALAHHHLGHAAEAAQALEKARTLQSKAETSDLWDKLEIELLRRETEAVIAGKIGGNRAQQRGP